MLMVLILIIIYAILLYKLLDYHVFFYIDFYKTFTKEDKIKFKYYLRDDINNMNKLKIFLKGFFLIPIRLVLYIILLLSVYFNWKLLCFVFNIKNYEEEQSKTFVKLNQFIINIHAKLYCLVLGFNFKYNVIKSNKSTPKYERENAKVFVGNHSSWLDVHYFFTFKPIPSMLVNHHAKNFYLYGFFCELNQNIFVNRGESTKNNNKKEVFNLLNKRVKNLKEGKNFKPLLIFPQGTTCNSNIILPFKKGAFTTGLPVRMFAFDYRKNNIVPEYTLFDRLGAWLIYITSLQNNIIVNEIDYLLYPKDYTNSEGEIDSERMAKDCRKIIAESIGLEYFDCDDVYKRVSEYIIFQDNYFKINRNKKRRLFNFF